MTIQVELDQRRNLVGYRGRPTRHCAGEIRRRIPAENLPRHATGTGRLTAKVCVPC